MAKKAPLLVIVPGFEESRGEVSQGIGNLNRELHTLHDHFGNKGTVVIEQGHQMTPGMGTYIHSQATFFGWEVQFLEARTGNRQLETFKFQEDLMEELIRVKRRGNDSYISPDYIDQARTSGVISDKQLMMMQNFRTHTLNELKGERADVTRKLFSILDQRGKLFARRLRKIRDPENPLLIVGVSRLTARALERYYPFSGKMELVKRGFFRRGMLKGVMRFSLRKVEKQRAAKKRRRKKVGRRKK